MKFNCTTEKTAGVCGVYCIIHRETLQCYVGSSFNIGQRKSQHLYALKNESTTPLHCKIRELGIESFDFEILERCKKEQVRDKEDFYMKLLGANSVTGLNTQDSPLRKYGFMPSEKTRALWSSQRIGRRVSEETKAKIKASMIGMKKSAETCARLSAALTGKKNGPHSEDHKKKQSAALKGRKLSTEHCRKISAGLTGIKRNPASHKKMWETRRANLAIRSGFFPLAKLSENNPA